MRQVAPPGRVIDSLERAAERPGGAVGRLISAEGLYSANGLAPSMNLAMQSGDQGRATISSPANLNWRTGDAGALNGDIDVLMTTSTIVAHSAELPGTEKMMLLAALHLVSNGDADRAREALRYFNRADLAAFMIAPDAAPVAPPNADLNSADGDSQYKTGMKDALRMAFVLSEPKGRIGDNILQHLQYNLSPGGTASENGKPLSLAFRAAAQRGMQMQTRDLAAKISGTAADKMRASVATAILPGADPVGAPVIDEIASWALITAYANRADTSGRVEIRALKGAALLAIGTLGGDAPLLESASRRMDRLAESASTLDASFLTRYCAQGETGEPVGDALKQHVTAWRTFDFEPRTVLHDASVGHTGAVGEEDYYARALRHAVTQIRGNDAASPAPSLAEAADAREDRRCYRSVENNSSFEEMQGMRHAAGRAGKQIGNSLEGSVISSPLKNKSPFTRHYETPLERLLPNVPVVGGSHVTVWRDTGFNNRRPRSSRNFHVKIEKNSPRKLETRQLTSPNVERLRKEHVGRGRLASHLILALDDAAVQAHFTAHKIDPRALKGLLEVYGGLHADSHTTKVPRTSALLGKARKDATYAGVSRSAFVGIKKAFPRFDLETLDLLVYESFKANPHLQGIPGAPRLVAVVDDLKSLNLPSGAERLAKEDRIRTDADALILAARAKTNPSEADRAAMAWLEVLNDVKLTGLESFEALQERAVKNLTPASALGVGNKPARALVAEVSSAIPELDAEGLSRFRMRLLPSTPQRALADTLLDMAKPAGSLPPGTGAIAPPPFLTAESHVSQALAAHAWLRALLDDAERAANPPPGQAHQPLTKNELIANANARLRNYGMSTALQSEEAKRHLAEISETIPNLDSPNFAKFEIQMRQRAALQKEVLAVVELLPRESVFTAAGGGSLAGGTKAITQAITNVATVGTVGVSVGLGGKYGRFSAWKIYLGSDGYSLEVLSSKMHGVDFGAGATVGAGGSVGLSSSNPGLVAKGGVKFYADTGLEKTDGKGMVFRAPLAKDNAGAVDIEKTRIEMHNLVQTIFNSSFNDEILDNVLDEHPKVSLGALASKDSKISAGFTITGQGQVKAGSLSANLKGALGFSGDVSTSGLEEAGGTHRLSRESAATGKKISFTAGVQLGNSLTENDYKKHPDEKGNGTQTGFNHLEILAVDWRLWEAGRKVKMKVVDGDGGVGASNTYLEMEFSSKKKYLKFLERRFDILSGKAEGRVGEGRPARSLDLEPAKLKKNEDMLKEYIQSVRDRPSKSAVYQLRFAISKDAAAKIDAYTAYAEVESKLGKVENADHFRQARRDVLEDFNNWDIARLATFETYKRESGSRLSLGFLNLSSSHSVESAVPYFVKPVPRKRLPVAAMPLPVQAPNSSPALNANTVSSPSSAIQAPLVAPAVIQRPNAAKPVQPKSGSTRPGPSSLVVQTPSRQSSGPSTATVTAPTPVHGNPSVPGR